MTTRAFIDQLKSGDVAAAKEALSDALSAKAFEALELKKAELAQTIYNTSSETEPEVETESE